MTIIAIALKTIYPDAEFVIRDNDLNCLEWHSVDLPKPTEEQIRAAIIEYENLIAMEKINKQNAKAEILQKLGISEEEAKLLLG